VSEWSISYYLWRGRYWHWTGLDSWCKSAASFLKHQGLMRSVGEFPWLESVCPSVLWWCWFSDRKEVWPETFIRIVHTVELVWKRWLNKTECVFI